MSIRLGMSITRSIFEKSLRSRPESKASSIQPSVPGVHLSRCGARSASAHKAPFIRAPAGSADAVCPLPVLALVTFASSLFSRVALVVSFARPRRPCIRRRAEALGLESSARPFPGERPGEASRLLDLDLTAGGLDLLLDLL